jgi:hypothetical protein
MSVDVIEFDKRSSTLVHPNRFREVRDEAPRRVWYLASG